MKAKGWTIKRKLAVLFGGALVTIAGVAGLLLMLALQDVPKDAPNHEAHAREEVLHFLLPGSLSVVVVAVSGLLVSLWVWRPLRELAAVARAVAAGDTSRRALVVNSDEVGEVATAFNGMLDSLEAGRADLQRRMEEQQRALARLVQSAWMVSVGLLAGRVAHEINNLLCIISNHLQLLRLRGNGLLSGSAALADIEANVHRIATSVQALLEYARGRPGQRQPTDLNEVVRRALFLIENHPLYGRVQVVTEFAPDLPPVDLDRAAWGQVILELVSNAREAMPNGGTVTIRTYQVAPPGVAGSGQPAESRGQGPAGRRQAAADSEFLPTAECLLPTVIVEVEDDGPGIPPENLPQVFDPFFTTKGPNRGMGLGLMICRDVVQEHGGRLRLESDGRRGTRVVIRLPACNAERTTDR